MTELGAYTREDAQKIAAFVREEMAKGGNGQARPSRPRTKIAGGGGGKWFRFETNAAFDTADATVEVTVKETWKGPKVDEVVTVKNLEASGGSHVFAGEAGASGYAMSAKKDWRIIQIECYEEPTGDWNPT